MKKIVFLLLISFGIHAQIKIKYSQMENPATSSVNLGTQTFSVSTITGSVTIGTGTVAANTSSLGILRVKQNANWADFGDFGSGYFGIWTNQATPTNSNYAIVSNSVSLELLNPSFVRLNSPYGTTMFEANNSYCYSRKLLRVGSTVAPSATLDVTGTMSVSGTSTLTGAAKQTNTLNYEGNTTWKSNATATLTTGNTGTVAVLSDAVFPVQMGLYTNGNPANATTYYGGSFGYIGGTTTQGWAPIYMPYNCTLIGWTCNIRVTGTLASSQSITLSLNVDNSATQLSTAITATAVNQTFTATALNTNVNAGSYIEPKWLTPTWGTPPANFYGTITFWFVRRQ